MRAEENFQDYQIAKLGTNESNILLYDGRRFIVNKIDVIVEISRNMNVMGDNIDLQIRELKFVYHLVMILLQAYFEF